MKLRDYCFWAVLTVSSVTLGAYLKSEWERPNVEGQKTSLINRTTFWLALWRIANSAPQAAPLVHELPDEVANAPAIRETGPDGEPLLAHGSGW
jgi:hypothetical protein